jgi:hypothetical protein
MKKIWMLLPFLMGTAQAVSPQEWYYSNQPILLHIVQADGMGTSGTLRCASIRDCYIKVLRQEARGATQYCKTISITRGGIEVWTRNYNN